MAVVAGAVRLAVVLLAAAAAWLARPYDDSLAAIRSAPPTSDLDALLKRTVVPLASWDGVFFQRIGEAGYEYEQFHAFFPLVPAAGRTVAMWLVQPVCAALGQPLAPETAWVAAAVVVSNVSHVVACVLLLWLTERVMAVPATDSASDRVKARASAAVRRLALTAATLFAFTPAGIFASAAYSESPFAALTFAGLLFIEHARSVAVGPSKHKLLPIVGSAAVGSLFLAAASVARSNGATHGGYLLFAAMEASACVLGPRLLVPAAAGTGEPTGTAAAWSRWLWGAGTESRDGAGPAHDPAATAGLSSGGTRRRRGRRAMESAFAETTPEPHAAHGAADFRGWPSPVVAAHARDWLCPCIGADARAAGAADWLFSSSGPAESVPSGPDDAARPSPGAQAAAVCAMSAGTGLAVVVAAPVAAFSLFGHWLYCGAPAWAAGGGVVASSARGVAAAAAAAAELLLGASLPAPPAAGDRPWCGTAGGLGLYGYVQDEYWGVGPFRYWELKQLPNFVLAGPALAAAVCGVLWYFHGRIGRTVCGVGGLIAAAGGVSVPGALRMGVTVPAGAAATLAPRAADGIAAAGDVDDVGRPGAVPWQAAALVLSPRALPYFVHWGVLAATAIVAMHIQVATRFMAACPALAWWLAVLWLWPESEARASYRWWVAAWLLSYTAAGAVLFPLFYPWT